MYLCACQRVMAVAWHTSLIDAGVFRPFWYLYQSFKSLGFGFYFDDLVAVMLVSSWIKTHLLIET